RTASPSLIRPTSRRPKYAVNPVIRRGIPDFVSLSRCWSSPSAGDGQRQPADVDRVASGAQCREHDLVARRYERAAMAAQGERELVRAGGRAGTHLELAPPADEAPRGDDALDLHDRRGTRLGETP